MRDPTVRVNIREMSKENSSLALFWRGVDKIRRMSGPEIDDSVLIDVEPIHGEPCFEEWKDKVIDSGSAEIENFTWTDNYSKESESFVFDFSDKEKDSIVNQLISRLRKRMNNARADAT